DAGNPVWADDIATFEKTRVQQIKAELDQALAENDTDQIFQLWDELQQAPWLIGDASRLAGRLADEVSRREHLKRRSAMEKVARQLAEAYAVFDEAKARALRDHWDRLNAEAKIVREDPLWHRVAPALHWMAGVERREAEEHNFQAAVANLERAFQQDTS